MLLLALIWLLPVLASFIALIGIIAFAFMALISHVGGSGAAQLAIASSADFNVPNGLVKYLAFDKSKSPQDLIEGWTYSYSQGSNKKRAFVLQHKGGAQLAVSCNLNPKAKDDTLTSCNIKIKK